MSDQQATSTPDTTKVEAAKVDSVVADDVAIQDKIFDGNAAAVTKDSQAKEKETVPAEAAKAAEAVTPEKYELKLMENSALELAAVEKISSYAKEKGLSQEAAQELLAREDEAVTSFRDNQITKHMEMRTQWVESIKADKEFGGDKFNESAEIAKRVINEFADAELKSALDVTGYGDNPALFKFVVKVGQKLKVLNDSYVKASAPSAPKRDMADIMYPNHKG